MRGVEIVLVASLVAGGGCSSDTKCSHPDTSVAPDSRVAADVGADGRPKPDGSAADASAADGTEVADGTKTADAAKADGSGAGKDPIGKGPFGIAYTSNQRVGYDFRSPVTATFDGKGGMTGYNFSARERPTSGTTTIAEAGTDKVAAWGRWSNGKTAGKFYSVASFTYTAKTGFHYAVGQVAATPPSSGKVTYTRVGSTAVTIDDGSFAVGTLSGSIAVSYSAAGAHVGAQLTLTVPGDNAYKINTTGGIADPSKSEYKPNTRNKSRFGGVVNLSAQGAGCPSGCRAGIEGFLAGAGASHLAFIIAINNNDAKAVRVAAVFKK